MNLIELKIKIRRSQKDGNDVYSIYSSLPTGEIIEFEEQPVCYKAISLFCNKLEEKNIIFTPTDFCLEISNSGFKNNSIMTLNELTMSIKGIKQKGQNCYYSEIKIPHNEQVIKFIHNDLFITILKPIQNLDMFLIYF